MSWWDIAVVGVIAFSLFRGYQMGLARRLTGWVGSVVVFFIVWFNYSRFAEWFLPVFDGEAFVKNRIYAYLDQRYQGDNPLTESALTDLIQSLPFGHTAAQEALRSLESAGDQVRETMLDQVAGLLAPGFWQLLFFIGMIFFGHIFLGLVGQILRFVFDKVCILDLIDRYGGALLSALAGVVLMTLCSVVLLAVENQTGSPGALTGSYFGPALHDAFQLFLRNGVW